MGEKERIVQVLRQFIESTLLEGNAEKSLESVAEDVIGVGMGEQGMVSCKEDARRILCAQKINPKAQYDITYYKTEVRYYPPSFGTIYTLFEIKCSLGEEVIVNHIIQSASARKEKGEWKLCMLLATPVEVGMDCINYYPLEFAENTLTRLKSNLKVEIQDMMDKSVSGGVIGTYLDNGRFPLYFVNESMLQYLGYTREEFTAVFGENTIGIVHKDDKAQLKEIIEGALINNKDYEAKFRVMKKDGSHLWMLERVRKTRTADGREVLIGIFTDITEMVFMQKRLKFQTDKLETQAAELEAQTEELRAQTEELEAKNILLESQTRALTLSEERFRIALEKTSNVIFDYDIQNRTMVFSGMSRGAENAIKNTRDLGKMLIQDGDIEEESLEAFTLAFERVCQGSEQEECVIKVRLGSGKELWSKISLTGVRDHSGAAVRVIGMVEDITRQKKEELLLAHKSEHDSMTGLYNKGTTVAKIEEKLHTLEGIRSGVFLMLDVDRFKQINDSYGHPFGDKILVKVSDILQKNFREGDIVGRLGGDEFCVFFSGITSRERIEWSARTICREVKELFTPAAHQPGISCSIGIALADGTKKSFEQLYKEADYALYLVKKNKRDGYAFYDDNQKNIDSC